MAGWGLTQLIKNFWINAAHILFTSILIYWICHQSRLKGLVQEARTTLRGIITLAMELLSYERIDSDLNMNIAALSTISDDSYLVVNVTISNPTNYWVLDTLVSTQIKQVDLINQKPSIPIILGPKQSVTKHYVFKLPSLGCVSECYSNVPFRFSFGGGKDSTKEVMIDPSIQKKVSFEEVSWAVSEEQEGLNPDLLISNIRFNREKYLEQNPVLSFNVKNVGNSLIDATVIIEYSDKRYEEGLNDLLINEQRVFEKELGLPSSKGLIDARITFKFLNRSIEKQASFIVLKEPEYEVVAVPAGDFGYIVELPADSIPEGTIVAYINDKEMSSKKINAINEYIFFEKDYRIGSNEIKFVLDYSDRGGYYYKIITVKRDYSTDFFGTIARFFESIINVFKILFS